MATLRSFENSAGSVSSQNQLSKAGSSAGSETTASTETDGVNDPSAKLGAHDGRSARGQATGPRTGLGKKRSSKNSLKFGIFSQAT
jgi:hypothetical protein